MDSCNVRHKYCNLAQYLVTNEKNKFCHALRDSRPRKSCLWNQRVYIDYGKTSNYFYDTLSKEGSCLTNYCRLMSNLKTDKNG